jgi:hypothetical protein
MNKKCGECEHLDKTRKQSYSKAFRYGCKLRPDGYVSTWINSENLLSEVSCNADDIDSEDTEETEIDISEITLDSQMTIDEWVNELGI